MNSRVKNTIVSLVIGIAVGVVISFMALDSKQPLAETKSSEAPSLRDVFQFASENLTMKNRNDGVGADAEFLKQQGLELMSFISGEPTNGTTRSVSVLSHEGHGEIWIRVFDSNGPGGSGYDFIFGDAVGNLRGFYVIYGH